MKGRVEKEIVSVRDNLKELQKEVSSFSSYIQKEITMLETLLQYYSKSDGATRKKILNTIFAEKLNAANGKVTEPIVT